MGARSISLLVAAVTLSAVVASCASSSPEKSRTEASKVTPGSPEAGVVPSSAEAGLVPACGSDVAPPCPSPKPSYRADIVPILNADCNTCHIGGPTGPWALTDYESLLDWKLQVLGDMLQCTMPPEDAGHKISDADRGTLIGWIACGAPNN